MKTVRAALASKYENTPFVAKDANIVRGENWTAGKLRDSYRSPINGVSDSPKYQRPDCVGYVKGGEGDEWQQKLVADFLAGHPIQPLHFRVLNEDAQFRFEIVDGGHRTRTIVNFLWGNVKTPENTLITSADGEEIDISNLHFPEIVKIYPFMQQYVDSLPLDVYEYYHLTDDGAEELFLKLNDLHDMTPADKRNAINNIIADTCRMYGSVDSPDAYTMLRDTEDYRKVKRLRYVDLSMSGRETDEIVSWALYYLYNKGVHGEISMGNQSSLNSMYRDTDLIARLKDSKDSLHKQLTSCLDIMNKIVCKYTLSILNSKKNSRWGIHALKKLIMVVAEAHYSPKDNTYKFDSVKLDVDSFFKQFDSALKALHSNKDVKHHPYQRYELVGNMVVALPKDKQPKQVNYGQTYGFLDVFKGGHRYDDFMFCYQHLASKGLLTFGKKGAIQDDKRMFSPKMTEILLAEQNFKCRRCDRTLNSRDEYHVDHIVPHEMGGITDVRNGQILCTDCNGRKSSGMHISDVLYVCKKMDYSKTNQLVEVIDEEVLTADSIGLVAKKLFG